MPEAASQRPPSRRSPSRRAGRMAAVVGVWLMLFEGAGWIADARWGHRAKLLEALALAAPSQAPVPPWATLPWPRGALMVRDEDPPAATPDPPYILGGKRIPDGFIRPIQRGVWPDDLAHETRKRVFILGGSAAFGYTVRSASSFAGLLGRLLHDSHAVFNAAQVAWASGQVVSVADLVLDKFAPDVLIVMAGNNEWVHWIPQTHPWADPRRLTTYRWLAHSRILAEVLYFQANRANHAAVDAAPRSGARPASPPGFRRHQEIEGYAYALAHPADATQPYDAALWLERKAAFLAAFERNLRHIIASATRHHTRVIVLTVPFNYRLSVAWKQPQPMTLAPRHRDEVRRLLADATGELAAGAVDGALIHLDAALAMDPRSPILHYLRGYCLTQRGGDEDAAAERAYAMAREHVVGDLGGRLSINASIKRVAQQTHTELIDVRALFDAFEHTRGARFNAHLIDDDCHPNTLGHRLIARAVHAAILAGRATAAGD